MVLSQLMVIWLKWVIRTLVRERRTNDENNEGRRGRRRGLDGRRVSCRRNEGKEMCTPLTRLPERWERGILKASLPGAETPSEHSLPKENPVQDPYLYVMCVRILDRLHRVCLCEPISSVSVSGLLRKVKMSSSPTNIILWRSFHPSHLSFPFLSCTSYLNSRIVSCPTTLNTSFLSNHTEYKHVDN